MLIGLNETTCQADGQWNGSVPTCESEILKQDNKICFCECNHACLMAVLSCGVHLSNTVYMFIV